MGVEAFAVPLGHHLALVQDDEGEGRPVVGVVVDQGLGDGRKPRREGGVAGFQAVRAFGLGGEGILLRKRLVTVLFSKSTLLRVNLMKEKWRSRASTSAGSRPETKTSDARFLAA